MTFEEIEAFEAEIKNRNKNYAPLELKSARYNPGGDEYTINLYYNWGDENENFCVILNSWNKHDTEYAMIGWYNALEAVRAYNESFGALIL
jgi:hypothetical protein